MHLRLLVGPAASMALFGCLLDDPYFIRHEDDSLENPGDDSQPTADDDVSEPRENVPPKVPAVTSNPSDAGAASPPTVVDPLPTSNQADASAAPTAAPEPIPLPEPEPRAPPPGAEGDAGARCGDGVRDPGETCDGADLAVTDCTELTFQAFSNGTVRCTETCEIDTSDCVAVPACGNGSLNANEACEGTELGANSCATEGFSGGTLRCDAECSLDVSDCIQGPACHEAASSSSGIVYSGNTEVETNEWDDYSCSLGGRGGELTIAWTAEATGCFVVSTFGSGARDTILAVHPDCGLGDELACDDDSGTGNYAMLEFEASANTTYAILVDGFDSSDDGPFDLSVTPCPPGDWTCPEAAYGFGDGCDCGCGSLDPDCNGDSSSNACDQCGTEGSCAFRDSCDSVAVDQNFICE